jgi:hypothetical protein
MPCASLTTLTPKSPIVPAERQLFEIDVEIDVEVETTISATSATQNSVRFRADTMGQPCNTRVP